jgi:hypothetical protein
MSAARRRPPKAAEGGYYIDADTFGLGKILAPLRNDVTYPGDPGGEIEGRQRSACIITSTATPDDEWIPAVAAQGWLIITRDRAIWRQLRELEAVVDSRARLVTISGEDDLRRFDLLHITLKWWTRIEAVRDEPGPLVYTATRTSFQPRDAHRMLADARQRRRPRRG